MVRAGQPQHCVSIAYIDPGIDARPGLVEELLSQANTFVALLSAEERNETGFDHKISIHYLLLLRGHLPPLGRPVLNLLAIFERIEDVSWLLAQVSSAFIRRTRNGGSQLGSCFPPKQMSPRALA